MSRWLFYGPIVVALLIGLAFYSNEEPVPQGLAPLLTFLFALSSYGYGRKAVDDGDIGTPGSKIRRDRHPRLFNAALYVNHAITAAIAALGVYLLFR